MRTVPLAAGVAALLLAAGPAQAGECSGEIMALQAQMEETPIMTNALGTPEVTAETTGAAGGTLVQGEDTAQDAPAPTEPMDADAAAASQLNTAAGTADSGIDAAAQALARARALDQAGDEDACMDAIDEAKGHLAQ
jgi:hypothetical protein